ncbi:O-antigen ligase family protein [Massilia sp. W12]|uniref:O-antigen ligase family protein n=1 Tax=Massilia sp. W12 TaxID=3126507 RepID=UPI0030D39503
MPSISSAIPSPSAVQHSVARILLFALPVCALTSAGGMALVQLLILILSLCWLRPLRAWYRANWRQYRGIVLAFAGFFLVSAIRAAFHPKPWAALDGPLRVLLALTCIGFVAWARPSWREFIGGVCLGVLGAFLLALVQRLVIGMGRVDGYTHHPITFGDLALAMGVLALLALPGWRAHRWLRLAPPAALLAGLAVSVLSGSRGGWLALPLLAAAPLLAGNWRLARQIGALLAACALLFALAWAVPASGVAARVTLAATEARGYIERQDANTSVGIRLELWKASWLMFQQDPLLGVGRDRFRAELQTLAQSGQLQHSLALQFSSSHNDALNMLATGGLLDFSCLLLLYGAPLLLFRRTLQRHAHGPQHDAGLAGILLVLCFIGFGLTDVMFWLMMPKVFYVMFVGVLAGYCLQEEA